MNKINELEQFDLLIDKIHLESDHYKDLILLTISINIGLVFNLGANIIYDKWLKGKSTQEWLVLVTVVLELCFVLWWIVSSKIRLNKKRADLDKRLQKLEYKSGKMNRKAS